MELVEIREMVVSNASRVAELGAWPVWIDAVKSLTARIPSGNDSNAPGFDAGLACCLDLIPREKQSLAATLHAAYTPAAVAKVRRDAVEMDPDSETCWWLAACSVCEEGGIDEATFLRQLDSFEKLADDSKARVEAARECLASMLSTFETEKYGFAFGTKDGCMQGAYLAGHKFAGQYAAKYGIFFIGTYLESLGLEDFDWSDEKDEQGRAKSGPVFGSRQFVKCASEDEFLRAMEVVRAHLG